MRCFWTLLSRNGIMHKSIIVRVTSGRTSCTDAGGLNTKADETNLTPRSSPFPGEQAVGRTGHGNRSAEATGVEICSYCQWTISPTELRQCHYQPPVNEEQLNSITGQSLGSRCQSCESSQGDVKSHVFSLRASSKTKMPLCLAGNREMEEKPTKAQRSGVQAEAAGVRDTRTSRAHHQGKRLNDF